MGARFAVKRMIGQWTDQGSYLRGMLTGVREGLRFRVDRQSRQYVLR